MFDMFLSFLSYPFLPALFIRVLYRHILQPLFKDHFYVSAQNETHN